MRSCVTSEQHMMPPKRDMVRMRVVRLTSPPTHLLLYHRNRNPAQDNQSTALTTIHHKPIPLGQNSNNTVEKSRTAITAVHINVQPLTRKNVNKVRATVVTLKIQRFLESKTVSTTQIFLQMILIPERDPISGLPKLLKVTTIPTRRRRQVVIIPRTTNATKQGTKATKPKVAITTQGKRPRLVSLIMASRARGACNKEDIAGSTNGKATSKTRIQRKRTHGQVRLMEGKLHEFGELLPLEYLVRDVKTKGDIAGNMSGRIVIAVQREKSEPPNQARLRLCKITYEFGVSLPAESLVRNAFKKEVIAGNMSGKILPAIKRSIKKVINLKKRNARRKGIRVNAME
mmetsp:Transcript_25680/g.38871  ORF Transcript_25680/g.38871 Transcript_25680/m.38871 type:complete len:344 (-) Transcript_25680:91-1122(-)